MEAAPRTRLLALSRSPFVSRVLDSVRGFARESMRGFTRDKPLQRVAEQSLKRLAQRVRGVADLLDPPTTRRTNGAPAASRVVVTTPEVAPAVPPPASAPMLVNAPIDEVTLGLSANDMAERLSTIEALAIRPEQEAESSLIAALRSTDAEVSIAAIAALVARDDAEGAQALVAVIDDRSGFFLPITRLAAARALQQFSARPADGIRGVLDKEYDDQVREVLATLC